jgi:hypothetical protein
MHGSTEFQPKDSGASKLHVVRLVSLFKQWLIVTRSEEPRPLDGIATTIDGSEECQCQLVCMCN